MSSPAVSAIIIFFNAERFLSEAVESVIAQTHKDWELLLVDDGSADGSTTLAQGFAARHPDRVRYLEHPGHQNRGMSASRNLGLANSTGDHVAFLDADDVWLPHKLAEQLEILRQDPTVLMIYGRTVIWYSWSGLPDDSTRDFVYGLGVTPDAAVDPPALAIQLLRNEVQTPTTCNALMRRELFAQVGGFVETFRGIFEDQAFFIKACLHARVYVSGTRWALYRQHPDSCCAIAERDKTDFSSRLPLLRWIEQYFAEQQVTDDNLLRTLRTELSRYTLTENNAWVP
jgi:glycosyltransferase involved in cell wall biosynthesis